MNNEKRKFLDEKRVEIGVNVWDRYPEKFERIFGAEYAKEKRNKTAGVKKMRKQIKDVAYNGIMGAIKSVNNATIMLAGDSNTAKTVADSLINLANKIIDRLYNDIRICKLGDSDIGKEILANDELLKARNDEGGDNI